MKLSISRVVLPLLALAMGGLGFYHVDRESQTAPADRAARIPGPVAV